MKVAIVSVVIFAALLDLATSEQPGYHPVHYKYGYKVNDDYHKVDFGHEEKRDGKKTDGSYHVLLPDGRVQTVKYYVDGYSGYVADVSYADPHKPSYHPAPAPHPKPHYGYPHH